MAKVLHIGDLHLSFDHPKYLAHCKKIYKKYKCDRAVFAGDIVENSAINFHESDPDGMSPGDELEACIKAVKKWHKAFPDAVVTIGNHDAIPARLFKAHGIPQKWLRNHAEVLGTWTWEWVDNIVIDDVLYMHGKKHGKSAALDTGLMLGRSVAVGHAHNNPGVVYFKIAGKTYVCVNSGCGIQKDAYPFAYAKKGFYEPPLGCSVIIDGKRAYYELMEE